MMNAIRKTFSTLRPGATAFLAVALTTAAATAGYRHLPTSSNPIPVTPPPLPVVNPVVTIPAPAPFTIVSADGAVTVRGTASQTKVAENGSGDLFYDITIDTPADRELIATRKPTDMILVLDRSGSMGDENKLGYAKAAIRQLVSQLTAEDRFALVSFDDTARLDVGLTPVTPGMRDNILRTVDTIQPGGSTNISEGFRYAESMVRGTEGHRSTRVLLLSDGEANSGVTSVEGLSGIVKNFSRQGTVVSTIGMGLGFNQNLLSNLADHGMGNYSYLESLAGLDAILKKDLKDGRSTYAATSELQFQLGEGVSIRDASGYPIEYTAGRANFVKIPTGQLLAGSKKNFMISVHVPTNRRGSIELGHIAFNYHRNGSVLAARVTEEVARITVVQTEQEAMASIQGDVYRKGWVANNLGALKAKVADAIARGDRDQALSDISAYSHGMAAAGSAAKMDMAPAAAPALKELAKDTEEAFAEGAAAQNRIAKKQQSGARALQRSN